MKERKPFYDQIERNLIVLLFIIMTVVIAVNVVTRFVFNYTLSWGEQFARLLLVWISFAGISWGGKIDVHMRVTALSLLTKKKPAIFEIIYLIGDLAAVIYGFYLSFEIYGVMMMTMRQGQVL